MNTRTLTIKERSVTALTGMVAFTLASLNQKEKEAELVLKILDFLLSDEEVLEDLKLTFEVDKNATLT